ncbi:MAG: arginine repressor [Peptoniphilaceae bacterium]|nr:arginine repressor [Peptoniphilaceae bacterium]MDD7382865.1 arginine repressor [Peptoniphilaceae bacterium]MDY3738176.1 arginine repressor [Peptoniphilaceae bacterium]
MKKYTRQRLILDIIQNNDVRTQSQLSELLDQHGVDATQATISRDIKELRISKVQTDDNHYRYTVIDTVYDSMNERLEKIFKASVLSVEENNDLVIVKCIAYTATVCGLFITNAKISNIAGIITGHDTIFISVEENQEIHMVVEQIRALVK